MFFLIAEIFARRQPGSRNLPACRCYTSTQMLMSEFARAMLVVLLQLSVSVWLGGYVTIAIVAFVSRETLEAEARVRFFRLLGRSFLPVGAAALACGILSGGLLLAARPWDGLATAAFILAFALIVTLAVAVGQARRLTRLRQAALEGGADSGAIRRGSAGAAALRALLGVLSLALVVVGSLLGS